MKKTLILTLVLVMALASTAFAGVNMEGEFKLVWTQDKDKLEWFNGASTFKPNAALKFKPNASGKNWSFNSTIASTEWWKAPGGGEAAIPFTVEQYKLNIKDEYFTLNAWRRDWVGDKGDPVGLLPTAGGWPHSADRVRLEVPVAGVATITSDYEVQRKSIFTFVDFDVAGTPLGLRYDRKFGDASDSVAAYAMLDFGVVEVQPIVGMTLTEDKEDNLGFGVRTIVPIVTDLKANINFKERQANFEGGRLREVNAILDYTDLVRGQVVFSQTGDDLGETKTTVNAYYRANTKKGWGDLFANDHWFDIKDIAARAEVTLQKDKTTYEAWFTSPIASEKILARANAKYEDDNYNITTDLRIQATDKVRLTPEVKYASASEELNLTGRVNYIVGNLDVGLSFGQNYKAGASNGQTGSLTMKVKF